MTRLILIDPEKAGLSPDQYRDLGACTPEVWEQLLLQTEELAEKARRFDAVDPRMTLLIQALDTAGLFRGTQIDLSGILRPYIRREIIEAEQKTGLAKKLDAFRRKQRGRLIQWAVSGFMNILSKIPAMVRK